MSLDEAATDADWKVEERPEEMVMQAIAPQPCALSSWNAASNAPGEGAAVVGRSSELLTIAQNSSPVRVRRYCGSLSPRRTSRGTEMTSARANTDWGKSLELSVTTPILN